MQTNRRGFLGRAMGASAAVVAGGRLPAALLHAAEQAGGNSERVLVVVQLSGGNDGLNTIVPYDNEIYYEQRPQLAIPKNDVLKIDDSLGFHPALRGFADLLESDRLAIVQGVGYPNPNRSHFESMDFWHTCRRKTELRQEGWLGRSLKALPAEGRSDIAAIHLGEKQQPLALTSLGLPAASLRSLDEFRLRLDDRSDLKSDIETLAAVERDAADDLLQFVQSSTTAALDASARMTSAEKPYEPVRTYPASALGSRLETVSRLIDAGLGARVYYLEVDGFDTHAKQPDAHAGLLRQVGDALSVFLDDIEAHGHGDRVVVMSFSEFGRRLAENASEGTDHGMAAPLFLAGSPVRGGMVGTHPSLTDLHDGDLKHHTDFRQVYAALIERWFGCESEGILGKAFAPVDVLSV